MTPNDLPIHRLNILRDTFNFDDCNSYYRVEIGGWMKFHEALERFKLEVKAQYDEDIAEVIVSRNLFLSILTEPTRPFMANIEDAAGMIMCGIKIRSECP